MIDVSGPQPRIADDAVRENRACRVGKLFDKSDLRGAALVVAGVHERAIDYIEQAPALVLAAIAGGGRLHGGPGNVAYMAHKLAPLCARGARLRDVLEAYQLPLPIRKIRAAALTCGYGDTLRLLGTLPPSYLSQAIPDRKSPQRRWLSALTAWIEHLRERGRLLDTHFAWAAAQISRHRIKAGAAIDMADFVALGDRPLNPAWEWSRALIEAQAWHDRTSAGNAPARFGVMAEQVIDIGKHPDLSTHGGFDFVALRTPAAIHAEGTRMRHCVSAYVSLVINGTSHIVSVRNGDRQVATLEYRLFRVHQIKGRFNANPTRAVIAAAEQFVATQRASSKGYQS